MYGIESEDRKSSDLRTSLSFVLFRRQYPVPYHMMYTEPPAHFLTTPVAKFSLNKLYGLFTVLFGSVICAFVTTLPPPKEQKLEILFSTIVVIVTRESLSILTNSTGLGLFWVVLVII